MTRQLTLDLPEEIYLALDRKAKEVGQPLESLARDCLARVALPPEPAAPFRRWAGAFASGVPDAAERHDEYLGRALDGELQGRPDE